MNEEKVIDTRTEYDESSNDKAFEEYVSKYLTKMELGALRKAKGISQKELSAMSGLSVQCISDIENTNSGNPTLRSMIKYLECLGYEMLFKKKNM